MHLAHAVHDQRFAVQHFRHQFRRRSGGHGHDDERSNQDSGDAHVPSVLKTSWLVGTSASCHGDQRINALRTPCKGVHRNRQATPVVIRVISMYPPWTAKAPSSPVAVRMNLTSALTATRRATGTQTPPPRCIAGNVLAMGSRPASVLVVRTRS